MDIILATHNQHKLMEITEMFSDLPVNVLSLSDVGYNDDIEENGKIKEKIKLDAKDPNAQKTFVIETGAIHTVVSDGPFVVLELKQHPEGGYDKNTDKEMFPKWSPPEKSPRAKKYYRNLNLCH